MLHKWLTENNYYIKNPGNSPIVNEKSHTTFDGKIVYLPIEKEYEFIKKYAEDYKNGHKLYYVEVRPPIFKYMIDLDISDKEYWTDKEIIDISLFINKIINEFYNNVVCIVCKSGPKNKADLIHTGIHIIWPKLYVNSEIAMFLRGAILQKISSSENLKKPLNEWSAVLDEVIYDKNGYRMVYSDKIDMKTRKDENRIYRPLVVLNKEEARPEYLKRLLDDPVTLIADTSIRYLGSGSEVFPIEKMPEWVSKELIFIEGLKKEKTLKKYSITGSLEFDIINSVIKKNLPEYSSDPKLIRNIVRYPEGKDNNGRPPNILVTTYSRYCMNLGREHRSCGIYFHVSPKGLCQKCLCTCHNFEGRKNGLCKDFTSKYYPIPIDLSMLLFPEKNMKFKEVDGETEKVDGEIEGKPGGKSAATNEKVKNNTTKTNEKSAATNEPKTFKKSAQRVNKHGQYTVGMTKSNNAKQDLLKQAGELALKLLGSR